MRGCAWLTGINRHALHVSVCEQGGVAFGASLKVEPTRSLRLHLSLFGIGFGFLTLSVQPRDAG
jgi:hypothetical protein